MIEINKLKLISSNFILCLENLENILKHKNTCFKIDQYLTLNFRIQETFT